MLWTILITGMFSIIGWGFDLMQLAAVTEIPFVDAYLVTGWGYIVFLSTAIPPVGVAAQGFLFIISFKVILMIIRAIPLIGRMFVR